MEEETAMNPGTNGSFTETTEWILRSWADLKRDAEGMR